MERLDEQWVKEMMAQCYLSTKMTAKILFPDRFYLPFSSLHDRIFAALDKGSQQIVIKAPRGWGKTSIVNLAYPAKRICFQDARFIVPISNTATQAMMQTENLKRELLTNIDVTRIFGEVKSDTFSKDMWVTAGDVAVMPRGAGQQVRGLLYKNSRPDLIICDDLEDAESVRSPEQRQKLKEWFFADVCNSVAKARQDWRIIVIGTLLHEDSLLANLLDDPDWEHIELTLCDDQLNSNWEDFMSTEKIKALYTSYKNNGLLDVFYREYLGLPIAKENAKFRAEHFRQYREDSKEFLENRKKLENIVIVDPAKTTSVTADDSAVIGIGIDTKTPRIYVRDIVYGQLHPEEQYDEAFKMADRLGARTIGLEVTSLNEFITYPIKTQMIKRGRFYDIVELKARGSKEDRIAGLVPFYRLGYVYHNGNCCAVLEQQLLAYPRSKKDDVMDAVAYVVEMLELGERYFQPDEMEYEAPEDIEAEFLDDNDPALTNWRLV